MTSPNPNQIQIASPEEWFAIRESSLELHYPFGESGTPLRGFSYDRDATEPPAEFQYNADWNDGMEALSGAIDRVDEELSDEALADESRGFEVSVFLTDPSRHDGLGTNGALEQTIGEFDMVFHSKVRSVFHAAWQYGHLPTSRGTMLGYNPASSVYNDKLEAILDKNKRENEVPYFSFDASVKEGAPAMVLAEAVQNLRGITYHQASQQENMRDPDEAFFVPDMVHCATLQWLQLGIAGLRMIEHADEHNYGIPPEKVLLIAPVEHSALVYKLEAMLGEGARVNADFALPEMREEPYQVKQFIGAYGEVLRMGHFPTD